MPTGKVSGLRVYLQWRLREMNTITITLPDERWTQLRETATRLGVAPEELARASVEDLLTLPDELFRRILENVLKKNAELYQRLAAL
jgi:hypothetical protein